jgi:hypothetical protein
MKFKALQQVYRNHGEGGGSGGSGTSGGDGSNTGAGSGAGNGENNAGNNGGDGGQNNGSNGNQNNNGNGSQNTGTQGDDKKFTQSDIDRIVSERLTREKEKQERESREKQGEYEKLYGEVKPKFEQTTQENETLKKRLEALETAGHKQIDDLVKDWPKEVKDLDPGKDSLESRQAWVERVKPLAQKLGANGKAPDLEGGDKGKGGKSAPVSVDKFMANRYGMETPAKA